MGDLKLRLDDALIAALGERADELGVTLDDYASALLAVSSARRAGRGAEARRIRALQRGVPPVPSETVIRTLRDA